MERSLHGVQPSDLWGNDTGTFVAWRWWFIPDRLGQIDAKIKPPDQHPVRLGEDILLAVWPLSMTVFYICSLIFRLPSLKRYRGMGHLITGSVLRYVLLGNLILQRVSQGVVIQAKTDLALLGNAEPQEATMIHTWSTVYWNMVRYHVILRHLVIYSTSTSGFRSHLF